MARAAVGTDAAAHPRTVTPAVTLYWLSFIAIGLSVSILGPALSERAVGRHTRIRGDRDLMRAP